MQSLWFCNKKYPILGTISWGEKCQKIQALIPPSPNVKIFWLYLLAERIFFVWYLSLAYYYSHMQLGKALSDTLVPYFWDIVKDNVEDEQHQTLSSSHFLKSLASLLVVGFKLHSSSTRHTLPLFTVKENVEQSSQTLSKLQLLH